MCNTGVHVTMILVVWSKEYNQVVYSWAVRAQKNFIYKVFHFLWSKMVGFFFLNELNIHILIFPPLSSSFCSYKTFYFVAQVQKTARKKGEQSFCFPWPSTLMLFQELTTHTCLDNCFHSFHPSPAVPHSPMWPILPPAALSQNRGIYLM